MGRGEGQCVWGGGEGGGTVCAGRWGGGKYGCVWRGAAGRGEGQCVRGGGEGVSMGVCGEGGSGEGGRTVCVGRWGG